MIGQLGPRKEEDTKSTLNYSNLCPCASKNTMRTGKKFRKKNLKLNKINFKTSKIMNKRQSHSGTNTKRNLTQNKTYSSLTKKNRNKIKKPLLKQLNKPIKTHTKKSNQKPMTMNLDDYKTEVEKVYKLKINKNFEDLENAIPDLDFSVLSSNDNLIRICGENEEALKKSRKLLRESLTTPHKNQK
jgi:hypothetical protein